MVTEPGLTLPLRLANELMAHAREEVPNEACGLLAIEATPRHGDEVVRAIASGLASSLYAEVAHHVIDVYGGDRRVLLRQVLAAVCPDPAASEETTR